MRRAELARHGKPLPQVGDRRMARARTYDTAAAELPPTPGRDEGRVLAPDLQQRCILCVDRPQLLRQTRQVPGVDRGQDKIVRGQIQSLTNPCPSTVGIEATE
jgi:hypothetical protein